MLRFFFCCRVTPLDCETTPTGRLNVEKMAAGFKLERRETHATSSGSVAIVFVSLERRH